MGQKTEAATKLCLQNINFMRKIPQVLASATKLTGPPYASCKNEGIQPTAQKKSK